MNLAQRMQKALNEAPGGPIKPIEVERRTGFSRSAISLILNGKTQAIDLKNARKVERMLNVRGEWLADGTPPMRPNESKAPESTPSKNNHPSWVGYKWGGPKPLTLAQERLWNAVLLFLDQVPEGPCEGLALLLTHFGAQDETPATRSKAKKVA
ncbi:MAG: XRE family transcriptional regulator [Nevskiaceae bacterium]|nr:MAG: XRE family transcriptional regulator [Nevskiaceae bacterium]